MRHAANARAYRHNVRARHLNESFARTLTRERATVTRDSTTRRLLLGDPPRRRRHPPQQTTCHAENTGARDETDSALACAAEIALLRDLCPAVQQFLIDPRDGLDEGVIRVAAVGVGTAPHHGERGGVDARQRRAPAGGREGGERPGGVAAVAIVVAGPGMAADRVVGASREPLADEAGW